MQKHLQVRKTKINRADVAEAYINQHNLGCRIDNTGISMTPETMNNGHHEKENIVKSIVNI